MCTRTPITRLYGSALVRGGGGDHLQAPASGRRAEHSHTGWRLLVRHLFQVSNSDPGLASRMAAPGPCSFSLTVWPGAALRGDQGSECRGRGVPGAFTTVGLRHRPQEQAGGGAGDQALPARCPWVQQSQVIGASITRRGVMDGWGGLSGCERHVGGCRAQVIQPSSSLSRKPGGNGRAPEICLCSRNTDSFQQTYFPKRASSQAPDSAVPSTIHRTSSAPGPAKQV